MANEWDVVGQEPVATASTQRPQQKSAATDPWAPVAVEPRMVNGIPYDIAIDPDLQFDGAPPLTDPYYSQPRKPAAAMAAAAPAAPAAPTDFFDIIGNALSRGFGSAKRGFSNLDDALVLRGERSEQRSMGDIANAIGTPGIIPGLPSQAMLGGILDLVQKAGIGATRAVDGDDQVDQSRVQARREVAKSGVEAVQDQAKFPASALATSISKTDTGSFSGDAGQIYQQLKDAGLGGALSYIAELSTESGPASLPGMASGIAGTALGGPVGGALGAMGGFGASSYAQQYGNGILEYLQKNGVNVGDPAAVEAALADQETLDDALNYSATTAGISAVSEAASGGIGPGMLVPKRIIGNAIGREAANALVAQPVAQGLIGTAGDVVSAGATGQDQSIAGSLVQNILGEAGMAATETVGLRGAARARAAADAAPPAPARAPAPADAMAGDWEPVATEPTPERAAELRRKAEGTPDTVVRNPQTGEDQAMRGEQPQYLTDAEKAELRAADSAPAPDLTPRQPAAATLTGGESRDALIDEWRAAATPDERAAAAGRIAAFDAQQRDAGTVPAGEDAGSLGEPGQDAGGLVGAVNPAGAGPAPNDGRIAGDVPADGSAADGEAGAPAVPGELPAQGAPAAAQAPEIPDFPGLRDDKRPVEAEAREQVMRDPEAALEAYKQVPGTDGGRITNTDEAREIFASYNAGPEARSENAAAVHEPASWVAKENFRRRMEQPVDAGKEPVVFFTGGGTGAGKSTGPKRISRLAEMERNADSVFDGNLSTMGSSVSKIDMALKGGRDVHILYTFRDPVQAFVHGALPRAERPDYGRTVPTASHASTHVGAAKTFLELRQHYANDPRVTIEALWNDYEPGATSSVRPATDEEIQALAAAQPGTLQQELNDALEQERQAGRVSDRVYHGTRGEPAPAEPAAAAPVEVQPEPQRLDQEPAGRGRSVRQPEAGRQQDLEAARTAVKAAVGDADVVVVDSIDDLPEDVRKRTGITSADRTLEGFYHHRTGRAYVIYGNLSPERAQSRVARAAWVAAHEWSGHHGLRGIAGDQLQTMLRRAGNNDVVAAVVAAMQEAGGRGERPETGARLVEEALAELAAALRTGDFNEIRNRYGVTFTADQRGTLRALFDRILSALRRALGSDAFNDGDLYKLLEDAGRYADATPGTDAAPASRRTLLRNLTPAEQKKVTDKVAEKIEAQLTNLPPKREMAAAAIAGQAKRGWYRQSAETISAVFGADAPLFAGLLAATSPQISVEGNLKNALSIWSDWVAAGRPTEREDILSVMRSALRRSFGNSLQAWENNTVRALQGQGILSGPKVDSFMRNLLGNVEEVTNDAWMANFSNVNQTIFKGGLNVRGTDPGKGAGYLAMNARVREVARELSRMTGETWTPAEVQETIWSWAKTITEMADSASEVRTAEELVLDRAVTDELIASTPAFGDLFTAPEYRQILEDAGYADQLDQIDAQRGAARQAREESGAGRKASAFAEEDQLRLERRAAARIDEFRRARSQAAAVEETDEVPFSRRTPGRFEPLPGAPKVKGATGPDPRLVRIADRYARDNGIDLRRQGAYAAVDPDRAARIADAYEAMEHDPSDPRVAEAYAALIEQTTAQYRALEDAGYRMWFVDPENDPYAGNPWNAMRDLRANQSMGVFPTDAGFGSGATAIDVSDNPLMADTGLEWPYGSPDGELRPVLANDLFRAVHDAFGHGLEGAGFRADGEENAWQAHVRMFTGPAVGAITTETRGQNSWLNFGPHGETNRTAKVEDTVFADQKTGLMPEWTWTEGRADDEIVASRRGFSAKPRQADAVSVDAYHYSTMPDLTELDPSFAGTAGAGRERRRFGMGRFGNRGGTSARLGFYVREPGAQVPEPESVVRGAGGSNLYRVQLDNLYDLDADPRGFVDDAGVNQDALEEMIADAGFDGFLAPAQAGIDVPTAVVFDIPGAIPVESVGEGVIASRRNPQIDTPEFKRWFGESEVIDFDGQPLEVYHGTAASFDTFDPDEHVAGWFSEDQGTANRYADNENRFDPENSAPQVYKVYLSIQNPAHLPFDMNDSQEVVWDTARDIGIENPERLWPKPAPGVIRSAWSAVRSDEFMDALRDYGFDGIRVREKGQWTWAAFEREQIKSATGNSGAFDPANPSIIASRRTPQDARAARTQLFGQLAAAGYQQGSLTQPQQVTGGRFVRTSYAIDNARILLQDKMLPLLRAQESVSGNGTAVTSITLNDAMNAYRMENLMHGAVKNGLDRVHQRYIQPIQDAIRKSAFTLPMFEDYLYATAAPERNREIAKINKAMPDGGAGITTQAATDILAGRAPGAISGETLSPEALALFRSLEPLVRKMRDEVLQNMVEANQITPQLAAALKAKYPNYIPMRGKDGELDEQRGGTGRGISQRAGAGLRRALGRGDSNIPQNIMGEMVGDLQRSIVGQEKAKVARAFLRFALANPQPDLYTVEPVDLEWKFSEATGEAYLGVKRRGEDVDNTMIVMHDGNPVYLRVTDPALRDAVLNMSANDMAAHIKWLGWINRWRSAVLTRFNPAFTPVNVFRDLQFGLTAVAAELGAGSAARTAALYPKAFAAAWRHAVDQRGDASKPNASKTMDDWAAEFYATGASTGLTQTDDVVDLQRKMVDATQTMMQLAARGRGIAVAGRALKPIADAIENVNEAAENSIRLAVYVEQRQRGISRDRAAEYAKNVTINFNRKGSAGSVLNAFYLFYNAAMQGSHAVLRVLRNRKVQVYLAGMASLQGLLAASMMHDDDDDGITEWDKVPDYVKRTSLVIPLGGDDYFAMPMPYGFNFFTYLGGRGTQRMIQGDRPTDSNIALDMLKSITEAFSPIPFQDGYRSMFGDQIGFMMGLAANTNDFGAPIAKKDPFPAYEEPAALNGKVTTPRAYHVASQMMAKLGGGDLEERIPPVGYLDVAPEQLEAVTEYFGGGIANLVNKGVSWSEQMSAGNLEGGMESVSKLPIMSRTMGHLDDSRAIADRYYGERGEFARHRDIVNARLDAGMPLDQAIADRPREYVSGLQQAKYKASGRTKDRKRYRKGQLRTDAAGRPVVGEEDGSPTQVNKDVDRRVKDLNSAIKDVRAGTMTNAQVAEMYKTHYGVGAVTVGEGALEGMAGNPQDLGLPAGFDGDAIAPARVRNRAIGLLQDIRAEEERRLLRSLSMARKR